MGGRRLEATPAVRMRVECLGVVVAVRRPLDGAEAEAASGERRPQSAGVLPVAKLIGAGDDRRSCDDQPWTASLNLEPVHHVLEGAGVPARFPAVVQVGVEPVLVD